MKKILFIIICLYTLYSSRAQGVYTESGYWHYFSQQSGSIYFGGTSSQWASIYTNMPKFIFNQPVYLLGGFLSSYQNTDLQLQTWGTTRLFVRETDGFVGIGTTQPEAALDVNGALSVYNRAAGWAGLDLKTSDNNKYAYINLGAGSGYGFQLGKADNTGSVTGANDFYIYDHLNNVSRLVIDDLTGNVGIGTIDPGTAKLAVAGLIASTEVKVEISPGHGPDYVFSKGYELRSLSATKEFIKKNNHLPEVPPAVKMEKDGIEVGEMNMILLKKIEELTLYQIELLERIEKLERQSGGTGN